jgi:mannose-6-phosphate isomerase-like protein (cupin superfamily)
MNSSVIGPHDGRSILNDFVIFKLAGGQTDQRLAIVEHVVAPGQLAAPVHTHQHEDEYSFVLEGELSALLGDELVRAGPGSLVVKPRHQPHTFWNQGTMPLRILELISPAGFEVYFDELAQLLADSGGQLEFAAFIALSGRYGLKMDYSSVSAISETYGVTLPGPRPDGNQLAERR